MEQQKLTFYEFACKHPPFYPKGDGSFARGTCMNCSQVPDELVMDWLRRRIETENTTPMMAEPETAPTITSVEPG